jgi:hypothetical protein
MIGGLFTSFLMELLVYPAVYLLWRRRELPREENARVENQKPETRNQMGLVFGLRPGFWFLVSGLALVVAAMFLLRSGDSKPLYPRYDAVRLALVNQSLPVAKTRANNLANAARDEDQDTIASRAAAVAQATDLERARHAFAELTDAMIVYRKTTKEQPRPVVAYCSMAKQSWLQPRGEIGNPYLDASMRACGEVTQR